MVVDSDSRGLEADTFGGSSKFARKTDGTGPRSGVLLPESVEGPDLAREREGELGLIVEARGDNVVRRTGAIATGSLVRGLGFEVDAVGCAGF
jgi:hypothetical protein